MANGKTALVLSAGGMFGAYQAGAWLALSAFLKPDMVVGASIGTLNGWAIAGNCDPLAWRDLWLTLGEDGRARNRYRRPPSLYDGLLDPGPFEEWVQMVYSTFSPQIPFGAVITEFPRLRPSLVQTPDVTWQHLAASCAVPGLLPMRRIDGMRYADGGVLTALPLWAAAEMGATRIVAVNVLQVAPVSFRYFVRGLRALAPAVPSTADGLPVVTIAPVCPLGGARDAFNWCRGNAEKWSEAGYDDAMAKDHIIRGMF